MRENSLSFEAIKSQGGVCYAETDTKTGCWRVRERWVRDRKLGKGEVSGCRFIWGKQAKDWGTIWKEEAEEIWISQPGKVRGSGLVPAGNRDLGAGDAKVLGLLGMNFSGDVGA